jgi:hypothetical protein
MSQPEVSRARPKNDRADLVAVLVVGAIAAVVVVIVTIMRLTSVFVPGGISVRIPLRDVTAKLPIGADGGPIEASVDSATVVVDGVNSVSAASFVLAILATALGYLVAIACFMALTDHLLRGEAFSRRNTRLLTASSIAVIGGAIATLCFETMGLNGVGAVLGSDATDRDHLLWSFWPAYLVAMALGGLAVAFRAGERLQRETEGLV